MSLAENVSSEELNQARKWFSDKMFRITEVRSPKKKLNK